MNNDELLRQMLDPDEEVRAEAREELTMEMDDELARAFLAIGESGADERVRADAIIGLGPAIEMAGEDFFDDEEDSEFGAGVSREMFDEIRGRLRALYSDESQPTLVRRASFEALVRDPEPWHADEIRRLHTSSDPKWKLTALFAMGYVSGFGDQIVEALSSSDGSLLYEAVRAAGRAELAEADVRIRQIAGDEGVDTDLRVAAIEALPYVDEDSQEFLEELADSEDGDIAEAAEEALEELMLIAEMGEHEEED